MRLSTVIGCLLYIIVLSILDVRYGIADGASTSQPAVIGFINISSQNKGVNAVIDLLSTNLTKNPMIQLVEREQLDIAWKELELATTGLEDRKNLLKLGQLIRADGLGLFSLSEDGKILRVRLVDTGYGFRLLDTRFEWDEKKLEGIVEEIGSRLIKVIPKLIVPPEKEVLVGILSIRNTDPSSTLNWLELALPRLISSRLTSEPRIIVLEREDLNLVLEEKLFTRGPDNGFRGSMVLLEGEVKQDLGKDEKHFTLNLHIKQADGKSIGEFKIEGKTEKLPLLTENISDWLIKAITNSPSQGIWDIKKEAEQFLNESKVLISNGDWVAARPLIEVAYALDPENESIIRPLLEVWRIQGFYSGGMISSLEQSQIAYRVLNLLATQLQRGMKEYEIFMYLENVWSYLNSASSVKTEDIKIFNRQTRRYCEDLSKRAFLLEKNSTAWYLKIQYPFQWASAVSETPEEAIKRIKESVYKILLKPEDGGYPISDEERINGLYQCLICNNSSVHILRAGHLDVKKARNLWLNFLSELTRSNDPVAKIMAEIGFSNISRGNPPAAEFYDHAERVIEILFEELNYPNEPLTPEGKRVLRWAIQHETMEINLYESCPDVWVEKIEKVLRPLLDKRDMENLILWHPSIFFSAIEKLKCDANACKRILNLLDYVINALENADKYYVEWAAQTVGHGQLKLNPQVSSLKFIRMKFLKSHPTIKSGESSPSELKVKILCNLNDIMPAIELKDRWGIVMNKATREGSILWVSSSIVVGGNWPYDEEVSLVGINLEDKSIHSFWSTSFTSVITRFTRPVVGTDVTYLGVPGIGIVKFPGTSKHGIERLENLDVISEKDGIPSNYISGIARVGNKLYVSVGIFAEKESGFGVYDLKDEKWKTISSSRSKDRSCPLNIERPYSITSLTPTSDGKKLFFVCNQDNGPLTGFWKMDVESEKLEHIWKGSSHCFLDIVPEEKNWWVRGTEGLISFDPNLEIGKIIVEWLGAWGSSYYKHITPATVGREPLSTENIYANEELQFMYYHGLFKDVFWTLIEPGQNIPCCIFINQPVPKVKKFGVDILGEDKITGLYPTPYGVVVIGKNKIGLIEKNPEP